MMDENDYYLHPKFPLFVKRFDIENQSNVKLVFVVGMHNCQNSSEDMFVNDIGFS